MTTTTTDRRETAAAMVELYLADWDRQQWMSDHGEWASAEWDAARDEYVARAAEAAEAAEAAADDAETAATEAAEAAEAAADDAETAATEAAEAAEAADDEAIEAAEAARRSAAADAARAAVAAAESAAARAAADAAIEAAEAARSLADAVAYLSDDGDDPEYLYVITELADAADSLGLDDLAAALRVMAEAARALDGQVTPDNDYIAEGRIDPDDVADEDGTVAWSERWQGWDCTEGQEAILLDDGRVVAHWWRNAYGQQRHARDLWIVVGELEDDA